MKKIFLNSVIILGTIAILSSCSKNFLSTKPLDEYSEADVWSDPALIEPYINTMYKGVLGSPFNYMRLADYCDEAVNALYGNAFNFNKSLITSDALLEWDNEFGDPHTLHLTWGPLYANVRRTNIFFSKIDGVPVNGNQDLINRLKGEAYFLRAFTYYDLVNLYGGVPLITWPYTLDEDFSIARNTYEECISFITGQLDSAAMFLPATYPAAQLGRATKGAALALKSRVLLTAASDLHDPQKNAVVANGYAHPELLGYTSGNAATRWKAAQDAAKAVIDLGLYDLYDKDPAPGDSIAGNIATYFINNTGTQEDILLQFLSLTGADDYPALRIAPNGYNGHGSTTPLGEMVDDYEMKDGSKFDWNNPAEKANPYANRDARLYASILYEGAPWRQRPQGTETADPFNQIQVGRVYNTSGKLLVGGLDTQDGPINQSNGGTTGYYLRKAVDPSFDPTFGSILQNVPFRHLRYAEVLLNYAEASAELGQDAEARTYINMIRHRAGQPDLSNTLSGDALIQACRHERRIELAFEDIRFWDVRRWMIGSQVTHTMHRIDIRYTASQPVTTYRKPDGSTWSAPAYNNVENPVDVRIWDNKMYFFPIMRTEINKNNKLLQNPGY